MTEAVINIELSSKAPVALLANWGSLKPWPEVPDILTNFPARGILIGVKKECQLHDRLKSVSV